MPRTFLNQSFYVYEFPDGRNEQQSFAQFVSKQYWKKWTKYAIRKKSVPVLGVRTSWQYNGCFPFLCVSSSRWLQAIYYPWSSPTIFPDINEKLIAETSSLHSYFYVWNEIILSGVRASLSHFIYSRQTEMLITIMIMWVHWRKIKTKKIVTLKTFTLRQGCL